MAAVHGSRSSRHALTLADGLDPVELRTRRRALGLSQAGLAEALGVAANTVARWERGELRMADPARVRAAVTRLEGAVGRHSPEPRGPSSRRHNLPAHLPALIGRDDAVAELRQCLLRTEAGLLTLTGTGGCGKTRLALRVALDLVRRFPDGVWLVDLAALTEPLLVAQTLAGVLGVRERSGEPLAETLVASLEQRRLLLVLDNCEHLLGAVADLAEVLLRACPGVRLLATSREPLRVRGEITWRVPSLAFPDPQTSPAFDEIARSPAVQLFLAHARSVHREFDLTAENARAVAEVCARLDGLPLAVELAAATMRVLGVDELRERLDGCFGLLVGGDRTAPGRHRTLQATLDWSHQLLTPAEQVVFRRLSVFAGGCGLDAVEAVCSGEPLDRGGLLEALTGLVDKCLAVKTEVGGAARYGQLETVRQYAHQKLRGAGEEASAQRRHADWCLALLDEAAPRIRTSGDEHWMARLEAERNNLRAALAWCATEDSAGGELGLRMLDVLGHVWSKRQEQTEGRRWIERILATGRGSPTAVRVRVLNWGAEFATQQGDLQRSSELAEEALQLARGLGYTVGEGIALSRLGTNADTRGCHDRGVTLLEEGLRVCLDAGDDFGISYARHKLAGAFFHAGNLDAATTLIEDNLALATRRGDRWGIAQAICQLGHVASARKDYGRAVELLEQSLSLWQATSAARGPHMALLELGRVALAQGDPQGARRLLGESLRLCRDAGNTRQIALCLHALASVAAETGQPTQAATLFGAAAALGKRVAMPLPVGAGTAYARGRAAAQGQLGAGAFDRAWAEGRNLSLDQMLSAGEEVVAPGASRHEETLPTRSGSAARVGPGPASGQHTGRSVTPQADVLRLVAQATTDRQLAAEPVPDEETVGRRPAAASMDLGAIGAGSGTRTGPAGLTPRETEILRLVAAGKSNGEIAAALVISIRTAERHLANIYTKLGTGGVVARVTATAYAHTHGVVARDAP